MIGFANGTLYETVRFKMLAFIFVVLTHCSYASAVDTLPMIHSDFSTKNSGVITETDSGHFLNLVTNSGDNAELEIIDGFVTNRANGNEPSAGHMMVSGLLHDVTHIGAEFEFSEGITNEGSIALVLWSEQLVYPGPIVDTEMHISFSNLTWNIGAFRDGVYESYATGTYRNPLKGNTEYRVEVVIEENQIYVALPDSSIVSLVNPNMEESNRLVPSWEVYQKNASTDWKAKVKSIWADNRRNVPAIVSTSKFSLYETVSKSITSAMSSAVDYPTNDIGNVGLRLPRKSQIITNELDLPFIAPSSGKVLVEFSGKVDVFQPGLITWTLLINEAGYSEHRVITNQNYRMIQKAHWIVTGLTANQRYTVQWQHRQLTGSAVMRLNKAGGEVASVVVTPLQ